MNTTTVSFARRPEPLLLAGTRFAAALAVVGGLAAAWLATEHASHRAVVTVSSAIAAPAHVMLSTVEIVGRREKASEAVATSGNTRAAL